MNLNETLGNQPSTTYHGYTEPQVSSDIERNTYVDKIKVRCMQLKVLYKGSAREWWKARFEVSVLGCKHDYRLKVFIYPSTEGFVKRPSKISNGEKDSDVIINLDSQLYYEIYALKTPIFCS